MNKKIILQMNKKNGLKKFLKKVLLICSVISINIFIFVGTVGAVKLNSTDIKNGGDCGELIKYKGTIVKTYFAYYENNGKQYPAYCLDKTKHGVSDSLAYSVSVEDSIHDVILWRYIINGYPYKTYQELGCLNKEEAFTATKQAIYCYIHGNDINSYSPIGEAGERTVSAIKQIVNSAQKSLDNQPSGTITINKVDGNFVQDQVQTEYVSKTYQISAGASYSNYSVLLQSANTQLAEGAKIVDMNNNTKSTFAVNEKFKVLIPIKNMKADGDFKIIINSNLNTKPVFYGRANNSSYQDYALTAATYEDINSEIVDNYNENKSSLKILKKDKETNSRLAGVEFEVLDQNKEIIYANLKTDVNGEIVLKYILPGVYYIRETNALDGYVKDSQLLKIEAKLNETITVTFNNVKELKPEIKVGEKEVEATYYEQQVNQSSKVQKATYVKKLPVTGM